MTQDAIVQVVRVQPDQAAAQRTESALRRVRAELKGISSDATAASSSSRSLSSALSATPSAGGGRLAQVRNVAGVAGGLASTVGGGQAVSALSSVLGLTQALGPFGIAAGLAVLAIKSATDAEQKRAEAAAAYTNAVKGAAGLTSAEIERQISTRQVEVQALQGSRKALEFYRSEMLALEEQERSGALTHAQAVENFKGLNANVFNLTGGLIGAKDGIGETITSVRVFDAALTDNQKAIETVQGALAFLGSLFSSTAVEANNLADAEAARTKSQLSDATRAVQIDNMTTVARQKQIAANEAELATLAEYKRTHNLTEEAVAALDARMVELNIDIYALEGATNTFADALARVAQIDQTLTDQHDEYLKALESEVKIREEITATVARMNEIIAERDARLLELQADTSERRQEIETEAAERLQEIALESAEAIARILRDAGREQFAAVASRDALAFYQSKISAADALDDQKKADDKSMAELSKHLSKQQATLDKGYQKQAQQLIAASNKQVAIHYRALEQLNVDQFNAQNALRAIALSGSAQVLSVHNALYIDMAVAAYNGGKNAVQSLINGFMSGMTGTNLPPVTGTAAQQSFNRMFDQRYLNYLRVTAATP